LLTEMRKEGRAVGGGRSLRKKKKKRDVPNPDLGGGTRDPNIPSPLRGMGKKTQIPKKGGRVFE